MKNFRALYFQGKRKLLKNPECKKYIKYSENFQGTLCFQGKRRLLKNPECNSIYWAQWMQGNSVFRASAKLLKNPEYKKYIQYSENFQGKRKLLKILKIKGIFNTVKNFSATLLFQGKHKLLKNRER